MTPQVQDFSQDWFLDAVTPHVQKALREHKSEIIGKAPLMQKPLLMLCYNSVVEDTKELVRVFADTLVNTLKEITFPEFLGLLDNPNADMWANTFAPNFKTAMEAAIPKMLENDPRIVVRPATRRVLNTIKNHPEFFIKNIIEGLKEKFKVDTKHGELY